MQTLISLAAYLVSVYFSWKHCDGYWVVGSVFAAAILVSHYAGKGIKISPQHILFLAASTLVYALVYWVSDHGWKFDGDEVDMLIGSLSVAVIIGSILMPAIHSFIFDLDMKSARKASFILIISWYVVIFLSRLEDEFRLHLDIDYTLLSIAVWQAIYWRLLKLK